MSRKQFIWAERLERVIAESVLCYSEAEGLEKAGFGERAAVMRQKSDRWFRVRRKLESRLDASHHAVA